MVLSILCFQASVVLPDTLRVPQSLTDTLNTDCDYYKISELNAADLVNEDFLTCFVKSGQLTLLSINTRIDCDSCLCITPLGHLILNVDKETYQALGLEGKVSHFHSKVKSRYSKWFLVIFLHLVNLINFVFS